MVINSMIPVIINEVSFLILIYGVGFNNTIYNLYLNLVEHVSYKNLIC